MFVSISITRFAAVKAAKKLKSKGISVAVYHIESIKPLNLPDVAKLNLKKTSLGLVLDDDYSSGVAKNIAFDLIQETGARIETLGLAEKPLDFTKLLITCHRMSMI